MALRDILTGAPKRSGLRDLMEQPEPLAPVQENAPLEQGLAQGFYGASIGSAAEDRLDAELAGDQQAYAAALLEQQQLEEAASRYAPRVRSYKDLRSIDDAVNYGLGALGQGVASMAPTLGGAAVGGLIGGIPGAMVGAGLVGHDMEQGEAIASQYADPEIAALSAESRDDAANMKGLAAGAAESLVPVMLGAKLLRPGNALATMGQASLGEAATETVQTRLGQASLEGLRNDTGMAQEFLGPVTDAQKTELIDSAIMGAISGGGVSSAPAASQALANTGKFGLDQAKKLPSLFQSDENGAKAPVDLSKLDIREHLKAVIEPKPDSARAQRPSFAPETDYDADLKSTDIGKIQAAQRRAAEDSPKRASAVAESILMNDDEWSSPELKAKAEQVLGGDMQDPLQLQTFLAEAKKQDRKNEVAALTRDAAKGGKELGDKVAPMLEKLYADTKDAAGKVQKAAGDALFGSKANLQNPSKAAREGITQILFENLKPEALQDDRVVKALPDLGNKLSILGKLGEAAARDGLTLAQYAQRTGTLNAEDVKSLEIFKDTLELVEDPDKFTKALQVFGNYDADTDGLPRKSFAAKDLANPGSTINSLLTPEARKAPEMTRDLARLIDGLVARRETPSEKTMGFLSRAFGGEEKAKLLLNMYARQMPKPPKSSGKLIGTKAEVSKLTEVDPPEVEFELDGDVPFLLSATTKGAGRFAGKNVNRLRSEIRAERDNDARGGGITVPDRQAVTVQQMLEEQYPRDPEKRQTEGMRMAQRILDKVGNWSTKGASQELIDQRQTEIDIVTEMGIDTDKDLAEQPEAVAKLLATYGAKRVETKLSGMGTGPTFRKLHKAGRRLVQQSRNMERDKRASVERTFFTYEREAPGQKKQTIRLSAESLVKGYSGTPEQKFMEAIGDLLMADPHAIAGSVVYPKQLTEAGGPFQLEKGPGSELTQEHFDNRDAELTSGGASKRLQKLTALRNEVFELLDEMQDSSRDERELQDLQQAIDAKFAELKRVKDLYGKAVELTHPANEATLVEYRKNFPKSPALQLREWAMEKKGRTMVLKAVRDQYAEATKKLRDAYNTVKRELPEFHKDELEAMQNKPEGPRANDTPSNRELVSPAEKYARKPVYTKSAKAVGNAPAREASMESKGDQAVAGAALKALKTPSPKSPAEAAKEHAARIAPKANKQNSNVVPLNAPKSPLAEMAQDNIDSAKKEVEEARKAYERIQRLAAAPANVAMMKQARSMPEDVFEDSDVYKNMSPFQKAFYADYKAAGEDLRVAEEVLAQIKADAAGIIGVKANKQSAQKQDPSIVRPSAEVNALKKAIYTELNRIEKGAKTKVHAGELAGGAMGLYGPLENEIHVSLQAVDPLGVAYHEALHRFFDGLAKSEKGKQLRANLMRAAEQPHVREQLAALLKDHPKALEQIESDPEERAAYLFQFYAIGKYTKTPLITLPPAATNVLARLFRYFQELLGVMSANERITKVYDALYEGRFADRNTMHAVVQDMKLDTVSDKLRRIAGPLAELSDKFLLTATDRLRSLGSAPLDELADEFAREAGREKGELPFLQRRSKVNAEKVNSIAKLFDGYSAKERAEALRNLQEMKTPSSPLEIQVSRYLDRMFRYMEEAGVKRFNADTKKWEDMIELPGYFPRKWDASKIANNEAEFRQLLADEGDVSPKAIDEIITRIKTGDGQQDLADMELHVGFTPFVEAMEKRKFLFITPANASKFTKFQEDDLADILATYTYQAVHRAEFARQFGNNGEKIQAYMARATRDLSAEQMTDAGNTVKALVGTLGAQMNPRLKQVMSAAITAENVILLPLTLFSQMIDALGVGLRSGDASDAWHAMTKGFIDIARALTRQGKDADTAMAETLGLIDEQNMLEAMGQAHGGVFMSKFARDVNRKFFRWNGMETWNRSMRVSAMVAGERFIIREKANGRYMRELGLDQADVIPMKDGRLAVTVEQIHAERPAMSKDEAQALSTKMQEAIFKFVDGAVLRPNSAQRPVWGSDPHWMLIFHLKQFAFSFQKTILARVGNELEHGRVMPAAILMAYIPVTFASIAAKAALTGQTIGDGSFASALAYSVQRSGVMGVGLGLGTDTIGDLRHGQLPGTSVMGPTLQHAWIASRFAVGDPEVDTAKLLDRSLPF
jgi:hypothetical protein